MTKDLQLTVGVSDLQLTVCIGARVGREVDELTPYPSADGSIVIVWTAGHVSKIEVNPRHSLNLNAVLADSWTDALRVQLWFVHSNI